MQSFIISGKNLEQGIEEAKKISTTQKVDSWDLEILDFESVGIEDIRKIKKKIFLKPFKGIKKSLILVLKESITDEAQNSMLKLLEEPPSSSLIFIVTTNHLSFLPTILSRVKIIEVKQERDSDDKFLKEVLEIKTSGEALALAQDLSKDKTSATIWLEELILSARKKMIAEIDGGQALKLRKLIHKVELSHFDLKNTNANARLILENLFLSIR